VRRLAPLAALVALIVGALALVVGPDPHRLGATRTGDAELAGRVAAAVGGDVEGYRGLSVAFVERGRITSALLGDDAGGPRFEAGSIAKALTGMLFADLVADGVVRPDDTLGAALPSVRFTDESTASITLEELASQRSGLPRLAPGFLSLMRSSVVGLSGGNPYGQDVDALLASAREATAGDTRGEIGYSNFGMALLGQVLAERAGTPYPQLVSDRILRPLGMSETHFTPPAEPGTAGLAEGSTAAGLTADPWSGDGYAPAGIGLRSTAPDLAKLVAATLAGTAPGADAARPRFSDDDDRIGYAWFTDGYAGREVTWHNGKTGGFSSYIAFDRSAQQGVVVLGNTDRSVEWIGLRLLGVEPPAGYQASSPGPARLGATLALLGWAAVALPALAVGWGRRWWRSAPDRLRAAGTLLSTLALLAFTYRVGTWLTVPPWLWAVAAGSAAGGTVLLALHWRRLPTVADGRPAVRLGGLAISGAISLIVIAFLLW
jgi:CubicO group peptidase (beta-lactamase class C family)